MCWHVEMRPKICEIAAQINVHLSRIDVREAVFMYNCVCKFTKTRIIYKSWLWIRDTIDFENGPIFGSWVFGNLAGWVWRISEGEYRVASCHSPTRMSMWRNQNKKDQDFSDHQIKKASNFWSKKPIRWRRSQVARGRGNLCQSRIGWMFWLFKCQGYIWR